MSHVTADGMVEEGAQTIDNQAATQPAQSTSQSAAVQDTTQQAA